MEIISMGNAEYEWKKKNTVLFSTRLFKTTDADIITELDKHSNRGAFVKRAIRYYIANGCPDEEKKEDNATESD